MAIDLGKWSWAANMALDWGAPALAAAFGVPGAVSQFAIGALKKALGLAPNATDADVKAAVDSDPDAAKVAFQDAQSEVTAKYQYLTAVAQANADVAKANTTEINQTIRQEAGTVSWFHWRSLIGYLVLLYGLQQIGMLWIAALWPKMLSPTDAANLFNSTTIFTGGLFALLGYVASDTTDRYKTAITGDRGSGGIVENVIKSVKGRK